MKTLTIEIPDSGDLRATYEINSPQESVKVVGRAEYGQTVADIEASMLIRLKSGIDQAQARHERFHKSIQPTRYPKDSGM